MGQILNDMIEGTPEMQSERSERRQRAAQGRADTVGDALGPVTNFEKGDIHFWATVAQLVVLIMIYREVAA